MSALRERFMQNVSPEPQSGCWLWLGRDNGEGYGRFCYDAQDRYAHRVAYELFCGPIQAGQTIDHLCRVRCCVNPSHLEVVSIGTNVLRGAGVTARFAKQTHCKRGHQLTSDNISNNPTRGRECKTCNRDRNRRLYAQQRA